MRRASTLANTFVTHHNSCSWEPFRLYPMYLFIWLFICILYHIPCELVNVNVFLRSLSHSSKLNKLELVVLGTSEAQETTWI